PSWPRLRVPVVRRDRLLWSLHPIVDQSGPPLALLSAPAGFGKTTLLSQFCQEISDRGEAHVAWVALDTSGTHAGSIWRAVLSALESSSPEAAEVFADLLSPRRSPDDAFLGRFLDRARELPDPTILVLDDVQVLSSAAVVSQLGVLSRRLPAPMRLVLSSRHDPAFSLHEARLAGNMVELRARELAFSTAETAEVLRGLPLGPDDIGAVVGLTEGWPAGVQLARSVLRRPGDGGRLAALFNAQAGILADYLFQETFTATSPEAQEVLLRTAVVPQLNDDLAVELTGRSDAGEVILRMEDLAPLLHRFDGPHGQDVWFSYHPLLRSYLHAEFARRDRTELRACHRRAALWFGRHGDSLAAIEHALASADADLIDEHLRRLAPGVLLGGEGDHLHQVLIEQRQVSTDWTAVIGACIAAQNANVAAAKGWLAEPEVLASADLQLQCLRAAVDLRIARLTGEPARPQLVRTSEADQAWPDDLRLLIGTIRGSALLNGGESLVAERELERAIALANTTGRVPAEVQSRTLWAAAALGRGDFLETSRRVDLAVARAAEEHDVEDPILVYAELLSGWVAFQRLDDAGAKQCLDRVRSTPGDSLDPVVAMTVRPQADLLAAALQLDDPQSPVYGLDTDEPLDTLPDALLAYTCFAEIRWALASGRTDLVRRAVDHAMIVLPPGGDVVTLRAIAMTAQGRDDQARRMLRPVVEERTECMASSSLVAALLLDATHAIRAEHPYEAFEEVQRALEICASTGGYRELVMAAPELLAYVSEQTDRLNGHAELIGRALDMARLPPEAPQIALLTDRELDILRELPTLNRVDEIAANLMVSTNTVKTHIRGVYRKLGVRSRKEAVKVARRRGLL
ncbi:MAG: LuxR C-terminal-related transcriptional regulator, partial [Nocardioidaceae bacterium]